MKLVLKKSTKSGFSTEVVNLLFLQHILTSGMKKNYYVHMLETKFDIRMFCIHTLQTLSIAHDNLKKL